MVLLAEVVYFFYTNKKPNKENNNVLVDNTLQTKEKESLSEANFNEVAEFVLQDTSVMLNSGLLQSSEVVNRFKGKVLKLETEKINSEKFISGYRPILKVDLEISSKTDQAVSIYFNQEEYNNTSVEQLSASGDSIPKTLKDIKVGQTIEVTETFSLMNDNRLFQYQISIAP